ncbi:MAG TPA: hypothetical protein VF459_07825 [Caulobacteraceae bacterium]
MFGIVLRALAAAVSFIAAGASGAILAVISQNPAAESVVAATVWAMFFVIAVLCAIAFSISLSLWVRRLSGR